MAKKRHPRGSPLLLLVLGSPPPVKVQGQSDRLDLADAVERSLASVLARLSRTPASFSGLLEQVNDVFAWVSGQKYERSFFVSHDCSPT